MFFAAIIGLIIGSFINCLVWRMHLGESVMGRSYCPKCRHSIAWYDNVPVISFIILKAKCRHCAKPISWQYPLIELLTASLFVASFYLRQNEPNMALLLARDWMAIFGFILIFIYDLRFRLVPMLLVWPLIGIMFFLNCMAGFSLRALVVSMAIGGLFFLIQYLVSRGKALGEGDIWLGVLMGATLASAPLLIFAIFSAYLIGASFGVVLLARKKTKLKSMIAFGPFLAIGTILSLFLGSPIISWYLGRL